MRVVLVVYGSLGTRSGGYLYDRMLAGRLESRGHSVRVVPFPPRRYPLGVMDNLSSRLLRELTEASPDLVLEDELCHSSLFMMNRRLRRRAAAPIVAVVHHLTCLAAPSAGRKVLSRALEKRFLSSADAFVFNSRDSERTVSELVGRAAPGVVACPGRDHREGGGSVKDLRSGPLRLLYVGNILPHKGLEVLVRAMVLLRDENVSLEVAGAPADRGYCRRVEDIVRREGLAGRVTFHGYVPDRELDKMLGDGYVLVVPSFYEGYGITCGEAYSHGVPVLASDVGGLKETVPPGAGLRVPPGDPIVLAERISFLDRHRERLEAMSRSAREHAASMPSWEESMGRAVDFLENIAGRPRAAI